MTWTGSNHQSKKDGKFHDVTISFFFSFAVLKIDFSQFDFLHGISNLALSLFGNCFVFWLKTKFCQKSVCFCTWYQKKKEKGVGEFSGPSDTDWTSAVTGTEELNLHTPFPLFSVFTFWTLIWEISLHYRDFLAII